MVFRTRESFRAAVALKLTAAFGALAITPAAQAQEDGGGLQDIVVTAQKRSESVQDIALAVTALGGDALASRAAATVSGLAQQVPSLNVSEQIGQARVTLRGIGVDNISTGAESGVAFNQDSVYYSRSAAALASFYDVDRIEVLRGPQGTLYGRNATGGSVNIITRQPTQDLGFGGSVTVGNHETINVDGYVTGGLSDTVAARLSFQTQHHDGYGRNLVTRSDIDTKNSQAVRGQLLFDAGGPLTVLIAGDYYRSKDRSNGYHYLGPAGETATGDPVTPTALLLGGYAASNERDIATPNDPRAKAEFYGGRIDIGYQLSDVVRLRSLTAYRYSNYTLDTDINPFSVTLFPLFLREKSRQFTQELQLNAESDRNKFVGGIFYLHENIDGAENGSVNLQTVGGPDMDMQGFYAGGLLRTRALAVYAQNTYSVTDQLRLTVGARYSWEKKRVADQSDFDLVTPYDPANQPLVPVFHDRKTFKAFTPKIGIEFEPVPDTLLYASFSKGFKSGTYNLGSSSPALQPEKVDAYEAGIKTMLLDRRLRANIAGFYYDYSDLQVGQVRGPLLLLENAATARIYGIEGEFAVQPVRNFEISLNASWLHARFRDYISADQARVSGDGVTVDPVTGDPAYNLKGKALPQSPNYTINLAAQYDIPLASGSLQLRAESFWSDRVYFSAFNRPEVGQAAYNLQNAYVTWKSGGRWTVSAYIKNIGDKTIRASGQVATALLGSPIVGYVQPPRTYGLRIGFEY